METTLAPYLAFDDTKTALDYYERVFHATDITRVPMTAEMAAQFGVKTDQPADRTIHARFTILGTKLFAADNFNGATVQGNQVTLMLQANAEDSASDQAARELYAQLLDSGEVTIEMPLAQQFWGGEMASFTDKFGLRWMLSIEPFSAP